MLKELKECNTNQILDYVNRNIKRIKMGEKPFPHSVLMYVNNPNIKNMSLREKSIELKQIFSELQPEWLEIVIEVEN